MAIYTYRIINTINSKYYIGVHRGELDDDYLGSGTAIKNAVRAHGRHNFKKEVLKIHDTIEEAWDYERSLVTDEVVQDPNSYNMHRGGHGGWDHVDIAGDKNPMRRPEVAAKISEAQKVLRTGNEYYAAISRENAKKGASKLKGRKRPEHASFMKDEMAARWKSEEFRANFKNKTSDVCTLYAPDGTIHQNVFLADFCKKRDLPLTTMWASAQNDGRVITKGKAKGWKCLYS